MRNKSVILLLIFFSSLIPLSPVKAETDIKRDLKDAIQFLYISDAILLPESELELEDDSTGMLAPVYSNPADEDDLKPILARIIHAKKMERNDLDANCQLLKAWLKAQGRDCDTKKVDQYCQKERTDLNNIIKHWRKRRGDQRKFFTKIWHNMKRNARNFWHRIGPVGRNFLRQMGDESLQMVLTGGLSGSAIKNLVKQTLKSIGRQKIREIVFQGVGRMLQGQIAILEAAGVDICAEEEESTTNEDNNGSRDCSTDGTSLDEYWEGAVVPALINENKNCQPRAAGMYRSCLENQVASGVCLVDAIDNCHSQFEAIPGNDSGGSVSLSPTIMHGAAESVSTSLIYPSEGGAVTGQFFYIIKDNVNICTSTTTSSLSGVSYDQATCTMTGMADLQRVYEGLVCLNVCSPSLGECPKTLQGTVPFEATLEDGVLYGGVGGEDCSNPGCFGFKAGQ